MQQFDIVVINLKHQPRGTTDPYEDVEFHFSQPDALLVQGFQPRRIIESLTETTAEIKPTEGLGSRASFSVTLADSTSDPYANDGDRSIDTGTFFSMMMAKNTRGGEISTGGANPYNKKATVHSYRVENGITTEISRREYLIDRVICNGPTWTITGKDTLAKINEKKQQYPRVIDAKIGTWGIGTGDGTFQIVYGSDVQPAEKVVTGDWVLIGGEVLEVANAVAQNITVVRHATITINTQVMSNEVEDHDPGDEVQICKYFNDVLIADYLKDVLLTAGIPEINLDYAEWVAELEVYHNASRVNGLLTEPRDANTVIKEICEQYQIDIWLDNNIVDKPEPLVRMTVTSAWQESTKVLYEGIDYIANTLKFSPLDDKRYSRAVVNYSPRLATGASDFADFKRSAWIANLALETEEEYNEIKIKQFDPSLLLGQPEAEIMVKRYIDRFSDMALTFNYEALEHKVDYGVGDVVDINHRALTNAFGSSENVRTQILGVKPKRNDMRKLAISAMSYVPAFYTPPNFDINDPTTYTEQDLATTHNVTLGTYFDMPTKPVGVRFVIGRAQKASIYSTDTVAASINAAGFPSGSVIELVLLNGTVIQSAGGSGGGMNMGTGVPSSENGHNGGSVMTNINAGVTVRLYLSGGYSATGAGDDFNYSCDGSLHAGGGGGGCASLFASIGGGLLPLATIGGNGGAGHVAGAGAVFTGYNRQSGNDGSIHGLGGEEIINSEGVKAGAGGNWGQAASESYAGGTLVGLPGLPGHAIINNSGTIEIYGQNATSWPVNGAITERFHQGSTLSTEFTLIDLP